MKKKIPVIIVSVFILVIAVTLLISKPRYSSPIGNPDCPTTLKIEESKETLSLIKTDYEEITLPKEIYTYKKDGSLYDNVGLLLNRNTTKYDELKDVEKYDNLTDYISMLIPDVSEDAFENRYYRQIILWWYMDLLQGMDSNHNYINGTEYPIEDNSSDKYDRQGNYQFDNSLSALEKKAILESDNGKVVIDAIEKMIKYFEWIETEEGQNTTNPKLYLNEIDTSKIKLHVTDDYIETNLIYPESVEDYAIGFTNYKVKVSSPYIVVDKNGQERTEFKSVEGFKVRIPIDKVNPEKIRFDFTIQGITRDQQTFVYLSSMLLPKPQMGYDTDPLPPGVITNCIGDYEDLEIFQPLDTSYEVNSGRVNIKVINAETRENLSGAEIAIYNANGEEVYRQTTTASEINLILPVGEYTIKQTSTPPNFEAKTIQQRIEVQTGNPINAVLENIPLIDVPNTSMSSKYLPVLGFGVLILGIIILGAIIKNKKHE